MTLNEELATWVNSRADWQKAAVARFCRNETLNDADMIEIADQLIGGRHPVAPNIAAADIPGSTGAGDAVTLSAVSEVAGINALLPGQVLSFSTRGLTIIFGNNASGKSGYARLIREAVTARIKSGQLLGDVFAEKEIPQTATIAFSVGPMRTDWRLGNVQSLQLSRIRFYDEDCGEAYVTRAAEIDYQPSGLTILDQLSDACEKLTSEIGNRLAANNAARPALPTLHDDTAASRFLESVAGDTAAEAIDVALALEDEHDKQLAQALAEEARLKGSDPSKEKTRLSKLSRDWSTVESHAQQLGEALNNEALDDLKSRRSKAERVC